MSRTPKLSLDPVVAEQQKALDAIAAHYGLVTFRPDYHGKSGDKNTVLIYTREAAEHNRRVDKYCAKQGVRPHSPSEAEDTPWEVPDIQTYKAHIFSFENSDANGQYDPRFANFGKLDLRGAFWKEALDDAIHRAAFNANVPYHRQYQEAGAFEVASGKLLVSDPMYEKGTWCTATIKDCVNGTWQAAFAIRKSEMMGDRVSMLCAKAESCQRPFMMFDGIVAFGPSLRYHHCFEHLEDDIGVDSASCGIFDAKKYPSKGLGFQAKETLGSLVDAACLDFGCVSESGYGDGGYDAFVYRNADGKVEAVCVLYI